LVELAGLFSEIFWELFKECPHPQQFEQRVLEMQKRLSIEPLVVSDVVQTSVKNMDIKVPVFKSFSDSVNKIIQDVVTPRSFAMRLSQYNDAVSKNDYLFAHCILEDTMKHLYFLMDVYTIAEMAKCHPKGPTRTSNAIVYCGDDHFTFFRSFFESHGFIQRYCHLSNDEEVIVDTELIGKLLK
jgi:hypothetical protein